MVRGMSHLFTAGPAVVAAIGENLDKEELGGADIHGRNGVVDDVVASEDEAFDRARKFLSYLPSKAGDMPPRSNARDMVLRREQQLLKAVPGDRRAAYNMRRILELIADKDSLFEMGALWGQAIITALARFDGYPVAILCKQPQFHGRISGGRCRAKNGPFYQTGRTIQTTCH